VLHDRAIKDPWIVYANTALVSEGVNKTRWSHNVKSFDELVPEYRSQEHKGKNHDGDASGDQCLGSGREITAEEERRDVLRVLRRVMAKFHDDIPSGWSELEEEVISVRILEYSRADAGGREVVHSASYQRESKRISSNVLVRYDEGGSTHVEYVCKVHRFIKASAVGCRPIRFATGDLHRLKTVSDDFGTLWMAEDLTNPDREGYGVMLGHMLWKI
jgi:hypothetical protein